MELTQETMPDGEWLRRMSRAYHWVRTQVDLVEAVLDGNPTQREVGSLSTVSQWFPTVLQSVQSIPAPRSIRGKRAQRHLVQAIELYHEAAKQSELTHSRSGAQCACGETHQHGRVKVPRAQLVSLRHACAKARSHLRVTSNYMLAKAAQTQEQPMATALAQAA